jgi:hypothetical protein
MTMNGDHSPCVDELARERADSALETARSAWQGMGELTREVSGLREEVRVGFRDLNRKLDGRASRHDIQDLKDEFEDSKVIYLKGELAKVNKRDGLVLKWVLGILAALIVAALSAHFGLAPK